MALLLPLFLLLAACSRQSITRDELRSHLVSAISFVAETETFIDHIRGGRSTVGFAKGHAEYLAEETRSLAKDLDGVSADRADADNLAACRQEIGELLKELELVRSEIGVNDALAARRIRLQQIGKAIEKTKASL
jgi:hypothetical protein